MSMKIPGLNPLPWHALHHAALNDLKLQDRPEVRASTGQQETQSCHAAQDPAPCVWTTVWLTHTPLQLPPHQAAGNRQVVGRGASVSLHLMG